MLLKIILTLKIKAHNSTIHIQNFKLYSDCDFDPTLINLYNIYPLIPKLYIVENIELSIIRETEIINYHLDNYGKLYLGLFHKGKDVDVFKPVDIFIENYTKYSEVYNMYKNLNLKINLKIKNNYFFNDLESLFREEIFNSTYPKAIPNVIEKYLKNIYNLQILEYKKIQNDLNSIIQLYIYPKPEKQITYKYHSLLEIYEYIGTSYISEIWFPDSQYSNFHIKVENQYIKKSMFVKKNLYYI